MRTVTFPRTLLACVGLLLLAACASATSAPQVWIDVPIDGLKSPQGASLQVEGHAAAPGGVSRVEVWIDGKLHQTIDARTSDGALVRYAADWLPEAPGTHTIEVVAFSSDGAASTPDQARVVVALQPPTATATALWTPTYTVSPTLTFTPTPPSAIEFWADPARIEAGACTSVRWRVRNAISVRLGGTVVDPEGRYEVCLCEPESYTLTVALPGGSEEKRRVDIDVEGECQDTLGPPAPDLNDPGDGESFSCTGSVELDWDSVDDPSGIREYQLQVQRHSGDGDWESASGSGWAGSATSHSISLECGWTYRWRVRAVDTPGNAGEWSGWSTFVDQLM